MLNKKLLHVCNAFKRDTVTTMCVVSKWLVGLLNAVSAVKNPFSFDRNILQIKWNVINDNCKAKAAFSGDVGRSCIPEKNKVVNSKSYDTCYIE